MMTPGRKIALGLAVSSLMLILSAGSLKAQDRGRGGDRNADNGRGHGDVQYVNHDRDSNRRDGRDSYRRDDRPEYRGGYYRPTYYRPVYYRPAPVYYTPAPVYYEPAPRPVVSIDVGLGFWFGGHRR